MKYSEFEDIMSRPRLSRYVQACGGDTRKAMTLYRLNLRLSQEMFTIISCFEVALRNRINEHCVLNIGNHWLRNGAIVGGIFDNARCRVTANNILDAVNKLGANYSHNKLVAELGFGFWRYMFARHQYRATERNLLYIFPNRPTSTPATNYNNTYVFNRLAEVNKIRNRIAHHEPICFQNDQPIIDTAYIKVKYHIISKLFHWMDINSYDLLYGLDHIQNLVQRIDNL